MSPTMTPKYTLAGRFPRVSGDEPVNLHYATLSRRFSPRERG